MLRVRGLLSLLLLFGFIALVVVPNYSLVFSQSPTPEEKKAEVPKKQVVLESKILVSPHTAEKALADQKLNHYVFKVSSTANKIMIASEVKKNYNVKVIKVNVVNITFKRCRAVLFLSILCHFKICP